MSKFSTMPLKAVRNLISYRSLATSISYNGVDVLTI